MTGSFPTPQSGSDPGSSAPIAPALPVDQEIKGVGGMLKDPSTLASTGLLLAVGFAVVAGFITFISDVGTDEFRVRLMALTETVDVGDVALIGIAIALLLLTPDPPGGVPRTLLMQFGAVLSGVIAVFGVIRAVVLLTGGGDFLAAFAAFLATLGVAIAAFTISFYAMKESFLKEKAEEQVA